MESMFYVNIITNLKERYILASCVDCMILATTETLLWMRQF